jgi:DNA repair exonuclease SbcCD ATPase subunit
MQLKARHRREVVEEILDIQIFSLMNMLLKQKLKSIDEEMRNVNYEFELTSEKISLQENYIEDLEANKNKILEEKISQSSEMDNKLFIKKETIRNLEERNGELAKEISDISKTQNRFEKLKGIQATLKEKHRAHTKLIDFFENNTDCPTCQQHIDETFKNNMIDNKKDAASKVSFGMQELVDELATTEKTLSYCNDVISRIQETTVEIAKENSSIVELEKYNTKIKTEIEHLQTDNVEKEDHEKLKSLKKELALIDKQKSKLREDKTYSEAARNMLTDTGIKTKIIKQYLPIMNKLINTYLTSMEFYVNFTLNENFEESIKSRYRDDFTYASFSEGEKMRIDLALLFTWRAVAKMKNSTNTNLLILDEIFDSSLDNTGTDEFLKILNTLGNENVFVISHKQDALADKFRNTIKFEKVKNFSHVAA